MNQHATSPATTTEVRELTRKSFRRKGITYALIAGVCGGLYSTFLTQGMGSGIWIDWYGGALSAFATIYILSALGSALCDSCSAVWCIILSIMRGELKDLFGCLFSKPGAIMSLAGLIGGPITGTLYALSLQLAGSIAIPIVALSSVVGAILARFLWKQPLTWKMLIGIIICFSSSVIIASTSISALSLGGTAIIGCLVAFAGACGWGIEGSVGGYASTMIDYQLCVTIRQIISGLTNILIIIPILCIIGGDGVGSGFHLIIDGISDNHSFIFFILAGFFTTFACGFWYKGNGMCGAALGMACQASYSFWGPLFCFLIIGCFFRIDGYALPWQAWVGAIIMVIGFFILAFAQESACRDMGSTVGSQSNNELEGK